MKSQIWWLWIRSELCLQWKYILFKLKRCLILVTLIKAFCLVSKALQLQQWTGSADRWCPLQGICHTSPWAVSHCCCFKDDRHVFIQKGCLFISSRHSIFHCSVEALSIQEGGLCDPGDSFPTEMMYTGMSAWGKVWDAKLTLGLTHKYYTS